jgi:hypothetical protein
VSAPPAARRRVGAVDELVLLDELWTLSVTSQHTDPGDPVFVGRRDTR